MSEVAMEGCDCTVLCEMGPTCPGAILAGLPGSGCARYRQGDEREQDTPDDVYGFTPQSPRDAWKGGRP